MAGNASWRLRNPYTTDDERARFPQEETVCETIESTMPRGPRSRPAHLAQARAFEGINHVFIGSCSAVVRKNSVTHRKARGSIRDAIRRGSDWHGLHRIPRGAAWTLLQLRETTGFADYSAKPGPKRPSLPRFPRGWIGIGVRLVA